MLPLRTPEVLANISDEHGQLALDARGNIYVSEELNSRFSVLAPDGHPLCVYIW